MKDDLKNTESFLARWSRLKRDTAAATPVPSVPSASAGPPPELPPLEELSFDSDFKAFLHPKVEERLKREALKKLFGDPHFNKMDGLDVYIDDYTIPDPLPEGMLENLTQYQTLLRHKEEPAPEQAPDEPASATEAESPAEAAALQSPPASGTETEVGLDPETLPDRDKLSQSVERGRTDPSTGGGS